jgi:hypothetical protein
MPSNYPPPNGSTGATNGSTDAIVSQLVRYARLCSRKESFVFHTRSLLTTLLEKQYRFEKLSRTVRAFIFKHPYLFACRSPEGLAVACLKGLDPKGSAR